VTLKLLSTAYPDLRIKAHAYSIQSDSLPLHDSLRTLLSAIPDDNQAFAIISAITRAFDQVKNLNSRYRIVYMCLKLATLAVDSLRHADCHALDALDDTAATYEAFILQGQTMTALWAITEGILQANGVPCDQIKPLQSDRYLALRHDPIAPSPSSVLICDELIREHINLDKAIDRTIEHFHITSGPSCESDFPHVLIAQLINPADQDTAQDFHVNVARVLGCNLRPHSTASCYSLPVRLTSAQYCSLSHAILTGDSAPYFPWSPLQGPSKHADAAPWDVTDTYTYIRTDDDSYCETGVTRLTSLLSGSILTDLSDRLGFSWSRLIADVRVDWHILSQQPGMVLVRFVPQVILNPISASSLKQWFAHLTGFDDPWNADCYHAAYDLLRAVLSSIVFDIWNRHIGKPVPNVPPINLIRDERAATLIMGPDLARLVLNPDTHSLSIIEPEGALFSPNSSPPCPHLGTEPERTLIQPFACPSSEETISPFYREISPEFPQDPDHFRPPARQRPFLKIADILVSIQDALQQPDQPSLPLDDMRADVALFAATAGDTWIRSECEIEDDIAYPAWRSAEVTPPYSTFGGSAPHIGRISSYAILPSWEATL